MIRIDCEVDVTGTTELVGDLRIAMTVCYEPEAPYQRCPVVIFCWPGGGYSRRYFDIEVDGYPGYSQAQHHAARGLITVCCDPLGSGDSSEPDRSQLTYDNVAMIHQVAVLRMLRMLSDGAIDNDLLPVARPTVIGIGQSYGAMLLITQQARYQTYDGIAVLGYSAIGLAPTWPEASGTSPSGGVVPAPESMSPQELRRFRLHWEDVPAWIIDEDTKGEHPTRTPPLPMWASSRRPGGRHWAPAAPRVVAKWAAVIDSPIFIGLGERDVTPDAYAEVAAYRSSRDVTLFIGSRMAHMHNFAGTRVALWDRICSWMSGIAEQSRTSRGYGRVADPGTGAG